MTFEKMQKYVFVHKQVNFITITWKIHGGHYSYTLSPLEQNFHKNVALWQR